MLVSLKAKFHIGLIPQHWHQYLFALGASFSAKFAISAMSCEDLDAVEYNTTNGEGFGLMKKTLNLAIATGRVEELYTIYRNFIGKMENEVASIKTKGQPKGSSNANVEIKEKRKQISESDQDDKKNKAKRPQKILQDVNLNGVSIMLEALF
ncbi:10933_t:CDS:2 [Gigaspora rosea]|nr:10933_t:CDS:2 [Gigaspora rosea]